jgi:antitoxin CptB
MDHNNNLLKKLIYQSHYRGSRENDKLLSLFARNHLKDYNFDQLLIFQTFLEESDPDIFAWVSGAREIPSIYLNLFD